MRTVALLALMTVLACDDAKDPETKQSDSAESKSGAADDKPKASEDPVAKKAKPKPDLLECDGWLDADLVKTHCGVEAAPWDVGSNTPTSITCTREAKKDSSRITVTFEELVGGKLAPVHRRRYPDPPALEKGHSNRMTVKGRKFPYLLTVGSSGEPLCTEEQLMALTNAIVAKVPGKEEPASKENRACDALLTPADVKSTCGKESTVNATSMEDGKSLYCNRSGRELIFIVSKHASDDVAKRGAEVAREDTAAGVAHKGPYSIEVKSSSGGKTCDKAGLDALATLVAGRL